VRAVFSAFYFAAMMPRLMPHGVLITLDAAFAPFTRFLRLPR